MLLQEGFPMPGPRDRWVMLIYRTDENRLDVKSNMSTDMQGMVQYLRDCADDLATGGHRSGLIIPGQIITPPKGITP